MAKVKYCFVRQIEEFASNNEIVVIYTLLEI